MSTLSTQRTASLNRAVAAAFGAVFLLVGLIGFAVTGAVGFAGREGTALLGLFDVNPLHNIVHLAVGALLLAAAARGAAAARAANILVGAVYLLVGVVGLFVLTSDLNVIALNSADNVLHLASAAALLGIGLTRR